MYHATHMKRSKRYKSIAEKIDAKKIYSLEEALSVLKEGPVKFDAGVELHMRMGIDPKKSDQVIRGTVVFPHGIGKKIRVAAFVGADKQKEAKEAGADIIGDETVIEEIKKTGKCDFDIAVATPDMMKQLGQIAKILGQQGVMPSPKTETVGPNVSQMIAELKAGKTAYRSDDGGNLHFLVGRVSFDVEKVQQNIDAVLESVKKAKPEESKGEYIQQMRIAASMGPSIQIEK